MYSTKYVRRIVLPSCCAYGPPRKMYCFWLNRARRRGSASLELRGTVFWRRAPSCWPPARTKNRARSPRTTGAILPVGSPVAGCTGSSKVRMLLTKMKNSVIWLSAGQRTTGRFPASCAILRLKAAGLPCAFVPGQVSSPCRCENGTVHCLNPPEKRAAGMLFLSRVDAWNH